VHFQVGRLDVAAEAIRVKERVCGIIGGQRVALACQLIWFSASLTASAS